MAAGTTLQRVTTAPGDWGAYRALAPPEVVEQALELGRSLAGARVLHVNATAYGGGVAELLSSEVGLLAAAGLEAEWHLICPDPDFFQVTKRIHNAMQGQAGDLSEDEWQLFLARNEHCAQMIDDEWDLVVVHDPQPAALVANKPAPGARWIWRCHIDTSTPDSSVWRRLATFVAAHDAAVFTLPEFRPPDLTAERIEVIAPAIDALSVKNRELPSGVVEEAVLGAGVDISLPLVVQVSRFDPWKDPLGVIAAWRRVREQVPDLQLALVGAMADDDPEAWQVYERVRAATEGEGDFHLLTNHAGIGPLEVNAFQRYADVVVQKSLREGFGLTVSEAMWKGTPVVGGNAGGIPLQIGAEEGGLLVDDVEACAAAVTLLLEDRGLAEAKGRAGRERVGRHFLLPRLVRDDLALYAELLGAA